MKLTLTSCTHTSLSKQPAQKEWAESRLFFLLYIFFIPKLVHFMHEDTCDSEVKMALKLQ